MGDITQADTFARRVTALVQEARGSPAPAWREAYKVYGTSWEADADSARALIFEARGQYSRCRERPMCARKRSAAPR